MENSDRILEVARSLFARLGLRCVSMDDIANNLGMSKKTLYQCYKHKDAIVVEGIKRDLLQVKEDINALKLKATDAVHELVLIMGYMRELFTTRFNPVMFADLQKYYPRVWQMFGDFRHQNMYDYFCENLTKGVEEGLYRPDLDVPIIVKLHVLQTKYALESGAIPLKGYDMMTVHEQFLKMFLYGITTLKGHELINHYLNIKEDYPLKRKIG